MTAYLCILCGEMKKFGDDSQVLLIRGVSEVSLSVMHCCDRSWEIKRRWNITHLVHAPAPTEMMGKMAEKDARRGI